MKPSPLINSCHSFPLLVPAERGVALISFKVPSHFRHPERLRASRCSCCQQTTEGEKTISGSHECVRSKVILRCDFLFSFFFCQLNMVAGGGGTVNGRKGVKWGENVSEKRNGALGIN